MIFGNSIKGHKADIMPIMRIFCAGISKAYEEFHETSLTGQTGGLKEICAHVGREMQKPHHLWRGFKWFIGPRVEDYSRLRLPVSSASSSLHYRQSADQRVLQYWR